MSLVEKIKALFESVEAIKFADAKLEDGTVVRIEGDLAEGAKISIIAEDGTVTPAPAGDHKLEDGTVVTVDDQGTITAVKAAEVEVEKEAEMAEAPVEEIPAEAPTEEKAPVDLETKVAELEAAITAIAEQVKAMMDGGQMEAEMAEVKKENKSLKKAVKELSAEPATPAANFKKTEEKNKKNTNSNNSMMEKILALKK